jgi:hypothetical protein
MAPPTESETGSGYYRANPYSIPDTSNPDRFTTSADQRLVSAVAGSPAILSAVTTEFSKTEFLAVF